MAGFLEEILATDALAFRHRNDLAYGVVTHTGNQKGIFAVGNPVDVEIAVFVGGAAKSGSLQVNVGEHHRLTSDFLIHEAFDAIVLSHCRNSSQKDE